MVDQEMRDFEFLIHKEGIVENLTRMLETFLGSTEDKFLRIKRVFLAQIHPYEVDGITKLRHGIDYEIRLGKTDHENFNLHFMRITNNEPVVVQLQPTVDQLLEKLVDFYMAQDVHLRTDETDQMIDNVCENMNWYQLKHVNRG